MTTLTQLHKMKKEGKRISCLTAYDATFARWISRAGVNVMLVGDSLGSVIQGRNEIPVTVKDICYHTQCVAQGNEGAWLIADLPFFSYSHRKQAFQSAAALMQAGAQMVKLEGGNEWVTDIVHQLTERGIPVCAHIGLTAQSVHQLGGFRVQGKTDEAAHQLQKEALALEKAGAGLIVLECMPKTLATQITASLRIPTIGIGAGPDCDGQILVTYDALGLKEGKPLTFVKNFLENQISIQAALEAYHYEVQAGSFPNDQYSFHA